LAGAGIRARIFNANASSIAGELPIDSSLPQLWVDEEKNAANAKALIDEYLRRRPSGPAVRCLSCGEESPGSFELCWNCGAALEALPRA